MVNARMHDIVSIEVKNKIFTKEQSSSGDAFNIFEIVFTDKNGAEMCVQAFSKGDTPLTLKNVEE